MNEQIIFYNHDQDQIVMMPVKWDADKATLMEVEKLADLGLAQTPDVLEVTNLITSDTFTVSFSEQRAPISMTYNEWETLRSQQANQQIQAKINALTVDEAKKSSLQKTFNDFTEGMQIKYLGQKSWTSIYDDLFENLK